MYLWLTPHNTNKLALFNMDRVESVSDDDTDGPGATLWFSDSSTMKVQESLADLGDLLGKPMPSRQHNIWVGLETARAAFNTPHSRVVAQSRHARPTLNRLRLEGWQRHSDTKVE